MDMNEMQTEVSAPAPQTYGTLEERGLQLFQKHGYDVADPEVKAAVVAIATKLRQDNPGKSDDDIAKAEGPRIAAGVMQSAPSYQSKMQGIQKQFSPEQEAKLKQDVDDRQAMLNIGRNLGMSARIAAGPEANRVLDQEYAQSMKNAEKPYADWQAKKQAAINQLENEIKMGEADAAQIRNRLTRLGLEQALEERANAQAIAKAEADPNSITSESYKQLARQYAPDLVARLGDKFNLVTASQLKGMIPGLEKVYLKKLEAEQKKAELEDKAKDRASREKVAATTAGATVQAAKIRAQAARDAAALRGSGAVPKVGDVQKGEKIITDLDVQLADNEHTRALLDEAEQILTGPDAPVTGPVAGPVLNSRVMTPFASENRQRLQQITEELTVQVQALQKGAASDKDAARYKAVVEMLNKDNPLPGIKAAREALNAREAALLRGRAAQEAALGRTPTKAPKTGTVRMKNSAGKVFNIPADMVDEARADGLSEV